MSKQLLVEYRPFEVKASTVKESMERHGGRLIVSGVLQRANAKNQNGRVYPKEVLIREAKKYQEEFIDQNRAMGELDHSDCQTETAEVLTNNGWKLLKDIEIGDDVFTLNKETNNIELQKVTHKVEKHHKGKMISLKGRSLDTLVTPNHRLLVTDRKGNNSFITAQEIFELKDKVSCTHLAIPKTGKWEGIDMDSTFTIEPVTVSSRNRNYLKERYSKPLIVDTPSLFAFLGFYFAEGGIMEDNKYNIRIYQNEGETAESFREVLKNLSDDLVWTEYVRKSSKNRNIIFSINDARLYNFLKPFGNIRTKTIPDFVKESSVDLLEIFFEWYLKGDGTVVGNNGYDRKSVFTISKNLIEGLHEILLKIGSAGTIKEQISPKDYEYAGRIIKSENKSILYRLWIEKSNFIHIDFRFLKAEEVDYDDMVYCLSVPNETYYCRDNNSCFWSGNSSVVELKNTSHHITKMWWSDDDLMGEVEILPTPYGNILKNLFEANITLGISSRGVGSVREVYTEDKGATMEVQSDFELISFDFVSNPSTQGAFLSPVNEGRIINTSHSSNIDKLISNIICDLSGVCDCEKK